MTAERPTVRPVTLARLVELTSLAEESGYTDTEIATELDVTERRARETVLEALRLGFVAEGSSDDDAVYRATETGTEFVASVQAERWTAVDDLFRAHSPHYATFTELVEHDGPLVPEEALQVLDARSNEGPYDYNPTSLDVLGDWAQRLGAIQRNAFSGAFYVVEADHVPPAFPEVVVDAVEELEDTAGVNLRQRYLPIPELRETLCEEFGCTRDAFDDALVALAEQNVGRVELSGAPIDTGAKDARYGIKSLQYTEAEGVVSTEQSSEQVMRGVDLLGKTYYYLAIHDADLRFTQP